MLSRVEQHIKMLGVFWIAYAAFHAIGGCVLMIIANTIFDPIRSGHPAFLHPLLSGIAIFLLVKSALCLIAGVGLLERQSWARTLVLVLAVFALINIPFGTVLGVYTLWVLMSPQADTDYRRLAASA
jgi:phage shock protein PspC (stress-responsive transcriptional regulator)